MKKVLVALFIGIILFSLVGCGSKNNENNQEKGVDVAENEGEYDDEEDYEEGEGEFHGCGGVGVFYFVPGVF